MANEPTARVPKTFGVFVGPLIIIGAIAFIAHHFAGTVAALVAVVIAAVIGGFVIRSALRAVVLNGPCPSCNTVATRQFENPPDPRSLPTACGACITYLRANGNAMREEALDSPSGNLVVRFPYSLGADQYLPAVKRTNRNAFKFEMPTMCASCGNPHATFKREIADGDHFGKGIGPLWSQSTHVLPQPGMGPSAPTEDDKNSRGLSDLKAPVCEKHTEDADSFGDVIRYSSGKLEFTSYRYYKAFCELNHIERASLKRRG